MTTPTFTVELISPTLAQAYLGSNLKNRHVRTMRVQKYARDMREGNWRVTGDPIKFASDGTLIDGQHRLLAIIEAETAVEMAVVRGVALDVMEVIDTGAGRTSGDALGLAGYAGGKDLAAAASVHAGWYQGHLLNAMSSLHIGSRLTHAETIKWVDANPGLEGATTFAKKVRPSLSLPIGALATAIYEFGKLDSDAMEDFFNRIIEVRGGGNGDPISTLLRKYNAERNRGTRMLPATALFMLFRTWNAVQRNERLVKLQFGSMGDWTMIPTPVAAKR